MADFEAYIAMPHGSSPDLHSRLEQNPDTLRPLTNVKAVTDGGPIAPYHDWVSITGTLELGVDGRDFDTDDEAAFNVARLLAGHICLYAPGTEIHRVAVGPEGRCTPPTITRDTGRDTVNNSAVRTLTLLATSDSSTSGISGIDLIGLGDQATRGSLMPIFPLVIETADARDSMIEVFENYEDLEGWAYETFDEWTITAV